MLGDCTVFLRGTFTVLFLIVAFIPNTGISDDSKDFLGFELGSSYDSSARVLHKKGVQGFFDEAKSTYRGKKLDKNDFLAMALTEAGIAGMCQVATIEIQKSVAIKRIRCVYSDPAKQVKELTLLFYEEKLFEIYATFKSQHARESMKGILGKFGTKTFVTGKDFLSLATTEFKSPEETKDLNIINWQLTGKRNRKVFVLFSGLSPQEGSAVALTAIDLDTIKHDFTASSDTVNEKQNKAAAKKLGF
jgi:hypothetical protein